MKYNKIVLFFCISAPACMLMRILQLMFTVEAETGFFNAEYGSIGYYLLAFIAVFCAVTVILCFTGHRNPDHPPKKYIHLHFLAFFGGGNGNSAVFRIIFGYGKALAVGFACTYGLWRGVILFNIRRKRL